ncbi:MAG TPA: serine--tRNA ligase, partial [Archangium sp.]
MLDLKEVAKNYEAVVARLKDRGGALDLSRFQALFAERKKLNVELEANQATKNKAQEQMKTDAAKREELKASMKELGVVIKDQEGKLKLVEEELASLMMMVPNVPHASVPTGADEHGNQVIKTWGEKPNFLFAPKQHFEIGEKLGMLDFERGVKVSGPRFAFSKGALARLERALVAFMIDEHTARGYTELLPPYLVGREAMTGTGQLPKFEDDAFKTSGGRELFLI